MLREPGRGGSERISRRSDGHNRVPGRIRPAAAGRSQFWTASSARSQAAPCG